MKKVLFVIGCTALFAYSTFGSAFNTVNTINKTNIRLAAAANV